MMTGLTMLTFSAATLIQIAAQMGLKAYSSDMTGLEYALFITWLVVSFLYLILSILRPVEFYGGVSLEGAGEV